MTERERERVVLATFDHHDFIILSIYNDNFYGKHFTSKPYINVSIFSVALI